MGQGSKTAVRQDILTDMAYHDYAVFIAHINAQRFFRNGNTERDAISSFTKPNDVFSQKCAEYRDELEGNLKKIGGGGNVKNYLYNPACFVAFGNNDNIAFVAMDDFDLPTRLASLVEVPVRQTCLAFCPKLESLGLAEKRNIFCEMSDICKDTPPPKLGRNKKSIAPNHEFLKSRPLLAVTYYKLNGAAVLGPGLLMQEAAYKAMAERIEKTLIALAKQTRAGQLSEIMSEEDVKSLRCMFLDPQGWSDVVTLMFCRNYSVIATLIAALRTLTFKDLYDTSKDGRLKDAIRCFDVNRMVAKAANQIAVKKRNESSPADILLRQNHAFCSTFSVLGISHKAFEKDKLQEAQKYYEGIVIADTNLNVCPGHLADMRSAAPKKYRVKMTPILKNRYAWYLMGQNDFSYQQLNDPDHNTDKVVELFELVQQIKSMRDCPIGKNSNVSLPLATHILESCTELRVPISIFESEEKKHVGIKVTKTGKGHTDIRWILDEIRNKLFSEEVEHSKRKGSFNIYALRKNIRKIRVPVPLSSSLVYLYIDFANYLCDPFLFDCVVNLYDIFVAAYQLLTEKLPRALDKKLSKTKDEVTADRAARAFLSAEDIEGLVELVELLQNALSLRVQTAFQEAERWSAIIDVRGSGLERILNAADAPLKCGLGILRRVMIGNTEVYSPFKNTTPEKLKRKRQTVDDTFKRQIGGACKISYNPRSFSQRLGIGENPDTFLVSVDLNIAHLFRPRAFYIHFHETAHLISYLLRDEVGCTHEEYDCSSSRICCHKNALSDSKNARDDLLRERYEDIFAEMLVYRFIFENDHRTYFRNYLANYSLDSIAYCKNDDDTFLRMFEVLMRGFLVTEPSRAPELYPDAKCPPLSSEMIERACYRFDTAIRDAGSFFFEFWHFLGEDKKDKIREYFEKAFREAYHPLCCIWDDVKKIYRGICEGNDREGIFGTDPPNDKDYLRKRIKASLDTGRPVARVLYKIRGRGKLPEKDSRLDTFFLIRCLLREHITGLYGVETVNIRQKEMCLTRNPEDGAPSLKNRGQGKQLHTQLLDRNFNDLFTVDPKVRSRYMQNRIIVIKTLWDVSTNLRARRMRDILTMMGAK